MSKVVSDQQAHKAVRLGRSPLTGKFVLAPYSKKRRAAAAANKPAIKRAAKR